LVIGLDALSPKLVARFAEEGAMPNIKGLMERGCFSKALSCLPAFTPTNWTVIATGARPGTTGIFLWGTHRRGEPLDEIHRDEAMSSNLCRAEYLWEAAARAGKRTLLFNFVGWPPTTDKAIHVDWFHSPGTKCFQIAGNMGYTTVEPPGIATPIRLGAATGWVNVPRSTAEPLEAVIPIQTVERREGARYHLLLLATKGGKYDKCIISREKDGRKALGVISAGEWTDWGREGFTVGGEEKVGTVRFKLVELSPDGKRLRLYRSQVYPVGGFTHPPEVGKKLVDEIGPYVQEAATQAFRAGWIDEETLSEELGYQARWIGGATKKIMDEYDCSLFYLQWHLPDSVTHETVGRIDPEGPNYDPGQAERYLRLTRLGYRLADNLVGEVMRAADEDTAVIVVSDHGMPVSKKVVSLTELFTRKGWFRMKRDEQGRPAVDWSKTKAINILLHIWINLKGRDPEGIVEPEDYEALREEIIDALLSLKDEKGERAILLALKREDAPLIGLWGEDIGDVVFLFNRGCIWGGMRSGAGEEIVRPTGGARHGPQPPTTETEYSSNYATFVMAGPGVKKGYARPLDRLGPISLTDVVPTIAYLLDIPPPAHSQGTVLYDMLEGWDTEIARKPGPIPIPSGGPRRARALELGIE